MSPDLPFRVAAVGLAIAVAAAIGAWNLIALGVLPLLGLVALAGLGVTLLWRGVRGAAWALLVPLAPLLFVRTEIRVPELGRVVELGTMTVLVSAGLVAVLTVGLWATRHD